MIRRLARAKVNAYLRVLGRRDDGYHEVETLIHPIELADDLTVRQISEGFELKVEGPHASSVPVGDQNLVLRGARLVKEMCGAGGGVSFALRKEIPVAAGLGGGSADGAAALDALAELWGCSEEILRSVAAEVGSDVPAMLHQTPVIARGRGEIIEPVGIEPCRWRVIPAGYGISAADAYGWWDQDGGVTGPDPGPLLDALRRGDLEAAGKLLFNDLEAPILRRHPDLEETKARLVQEGALGAIVSG
ncbi:MAG: 4-(cytidine 5'-diphospho)-2-C-methyl-D-erythritol kinase, partial [Actinobacteria bacterium]|nr:4-(cytidine 5'-diphospho)-2-C-methyl-D-erythritol kinase [Actinomycetota bacterium]